MRWLKRAQRVYIGKANRWLNIAGIASFLGTGAQEVAFVQTPHIGGTLFIYKYANGAFFQIAAMRDFSNHVIGSREMRLVSDRPMSMETAGRILPSPASDRTTMRIIGIVGNGFVEIASAELPAPIDKAIAVYVKDKKGFVTGLENGDVYLVYR